MTKAQLEFAMNAAHKFAYACLGIMKTPEEDMNERFAELYPAVDFEDHNDEAGIRSFIAGVAERCYNLLKGNQ